MYLTDGAGATWELETGSPTMMERAGWSADTLHAGDHVRAEASPTRNPARKAGMLLSLQRADGTVLLQRNGASLPAAVSAAVPAAGLAGN